MRNKYKLQIWSLYILKILSLNSFTLTHILTRITRVSFVAACALRG